MLGGRSDDGFEQQPGEDGVGFESGRRGRRRWGSMQKLVDEAIRKRFTPEIVDEERCLARVESNGRGGQCCAKRQGGTGFCGRHAKNQPYGLVTGSIPAEKVEVLLRKERRRLLAGGGGEAAQGPRRVDETPKRGRRLHWYARFYMWLAAKRARARGDRAATRGVLRFLEDLWPDEYAEALSMVNESLKHPGQQQLGGGDAIERDQGPGSAAEARERPALAAYNGRKGGQFFRWYEPGRFLHELRLRGAEVATCSEDQCMQALKATNEMLKSGKVEQVELVQYAGPQCYPQLKERLMANAVESGGVRRDNSRPGAAGRRACPRDDGLGAVVEQVEGCWLRCDDCGARRLVERRSLASLRAERFQKTLEGGEEGFWAQWLEGARSRYDDFVQKCSAGGAGSAPGEAGGAVAGGSVAEPTGLDGGSEGGGRPDAEMEEPGESGSEHGEVLRTDVRLGLEAAKVFLGGRGGGLTVAEQEQSDAL